MKTKGYLWAVILVFFAVNGYGADKTDRISDGYGGYWLNGFPFKDYKPETEGLQPRIKAEAEYIKAEEAKRTPASEGQLNTYVITGHSQGGLRALALGGYLKAKESDMYNKLDGIITISGIDRGLKALEGGVGVLASKVQDDINIVWGGVRAGLNIFGAPTTIISVFPGAPDFSLGSKLILKLIPEDFQFYYVKLGMENNPGQIKEIEDMTPRSSFIKTNVANIATKSKIVKEKAGQQLVAKAGVKWILFIPVPYIYLALEDVYRTYTQYWEEDSSLKIGSEMPVGYIVGTNNDVFAPLGSKKQGVQTGINVTRGVFIAAESVHIARCASIWGLFTGSIQYAQDAHRAQSFCGNINSELHNILGSSQNDGLVAKESQFYSTAIHSNQLGYREFPYSHEEIGKWENGKLIKADVDELAKRWAASAPSKRTRK
jgi:hypothetical protein